MRNHSQQPTFERPLIVGHRGASALAPENTIAAFERAFRDGADGLELDVRLARDGAPVVIHDATLRRTGLSAGLVAELSSKELAQVDVGSWFNRAKPKLAHPEFSLQHVPMLAEVLSLVNQVAIGEQRRPAIYVELKPHGTIRVRETVAATIRLIKDYNLENQAILISFDLDAVALAKNVDATIRTGALFAPKRSSAANIRKRRMVAAAVACGADEILLHRLLASSRAVEIAVANNLLPVVWTTDHPAWVRRAQSWGVHALITNNPARLKAALHEHRVIASAN